MTILRPSKSVAQTLTTDLLIFHFQILNSHLYTFSFYFPIPEEFFRLLKPKSVNAINHSGSRNQFCISKAVVEIDCIESAFSPPSPIPNMGLLF